MAVNVQLIAGAPEDVMAVLEDGQRYADWVVGAKRICRTDEAWPAPGRAFHHSIGMGPFTVGDSTTVESIDAPRRLELRARIRPFLIASVVIELERADTGTLVTMREKVVGGFLRPARAVLEPVLSARNGESLRRLKTLVEASI
jgi:uncharacterized protein YndB with AHSA1/START domain